MEKKYGTFIIDEKGSIIFYNGNLEEVPNISFTDEEIIGKNLTNIFNQKVVSQLSLRNHSGYFEFENGQYNYKRRNIKIPEKETPLIFLEIAYESDESVSFYSMLIHEIKNPLAAIRTLVQGLSDHIFDVQIKNLHPEYLKTANDYFSRILSEIDRLNRLLTSVKYITKHIQSINFSFNIIKVAIRTIELFENTLKEKSINLITNFTDENMIIYGDPDQFQQIFNNLISNAIGAIGDSKGNIYLNIKRKSDNSVYIEVKDEGKGIEQENLQKVFKAFYSQKLGGMGIGLTVVKMIIRRYKGKLNIESNPGQGTTVSIILPSYGSN